MANLTEISIATRKFFIWLIIVFIGYLILKFFVDIGSFYFKKPTIIQTVPPDVKFNKLPKPVFTNIATSSSGMKFTLKNIEGSPPEATSVARIYYMPKKLQTLLTIERAKNFAAKLGFTNEPENAESDIYFFIDPLDQYRSFSYDIVNGNFKLKIDYRKNSELFENAHLSSKDEAVSTVKEYISKNNLFDGSILGGRITTNLLTYDKATKTFSPATSISTTQAVRVNFFRNDLDNLKILPPGFNRSFNYALYTPSSATSYQILEIGYVFWPIAFDNFGTYPLRSSQNAWQDLVDGYALIINMGNNSPDNITIRDIYLAYYDSEKPQAYLQPIFVFEGDNEFIAYLPAVAEEWLE